MAKRGYVTKKLNYKEVEYKYLDTTSETVETETTEIFKHYRSDEKMLKAIKRANKMSGKVVLSIVSVTEANKVYRMPISEFLKHAELVTEAGEANE